MRKCSFEGCDRKHDSHGFCGMHAQRFRKFGDPTKVTTEEERRILSREAQPKLGKAKPSSYLKFLGRHEHRAVAEKMLGRKLFKGEIVHHKDGNKHNNSPENLEIMTQSQHIKEHRKEMADKRRSQLPKIEFDGKNLTISEWAALKKMNVQTIWRRLKNGWSVADALNLPSSYLPRTRR